MMMKPMNLQDSKEREAALDPSQSFIVQAPAGSGKTELLTQRFLVLLGIVKEPEEILAITFTKKSAAEMRTRVISALKNAENTPEPKNSHEKKTWTLAKNALKNNVHFNWKLLDNPNRLQIQTIDSFNASLTRHLPLLANFGAPLEIADDPSVLYREAPGLATDNLNSSASAQTALTDVNAAIQKAAALRGAIGAAVNQMQAAQNVENVQVQNITSAQNAILAANMPQVVSNLSKYLILQQTGVYALGQANSAQQGILRLLQ